MHFSTHQAKRCAILAIFLGYFAGCADAGATEEQPVEVSQELLSAWRIPDELTVPAGNHLGFWLKARGVQIYACQEATDGSFAWVLVEPDAVLYGPFGKLVVGQHYAGPTWELFDGSTVVGSRIAGVTVDPTAIPWLLLEATDHSERGILSRVTYIQRLYTVGGLAPASGCDAEHAGDSMEVPYTATYVFYY